MVQPTQSATIEVAQSLQRAGRLAEAEQMYGMLVQANPKSLEAWFLFGTLALQTGRHAIAADRLERAVRLGSDGVPVLMNLGMAYQGAGRTANARGCFERVINRDPGVPEAHNSLGIALLAEGKREEAAEAFRRAIELRPSYARAQYNLGTALKGEGRIREAADCFGEAARLEPSLSQAHANFGVMLQELGRRADAAAAYGRALALNPNEPESLNNLATLRREEGSLEEAASLAEKAIAARAGFGEAHLNLGSIRQAQNRLDEAIAAYDVAISHHADKGAAFYNLGTAYERKGDIDGALRSYESAIQCDPTYVEARWNKALLQLMRGDFHAGWQAYECRWDTPHFKGTARQFAQPRWYGQKPNGSLLAWSEQGLGDEILYGRLVGELADSGVDVRWEMDKRLVPLVSRSWPTLKAIPRRNPPDEATAASDIVAQTPIASLGPYLRRDRNAFSRRDGGYLRADEARSRRMRDQLMSDATPGERLVGLSWASKNPEVGQQKSSVLSEWAPILKTTGLRWVDLQYGETGAERAEIETRLDAQIHHLSDLDLHRDIDGLAALITACDLVITVSNTTAHLAGALGVPVWVLVPGGYGKFWYWGTEDRSLWYSSARLFRQALAGQWDQPIAAIARELVSILQTTSRRVP